MASGFVKIDRAILDSEIGDDLVALGLFIHISCVSNWSTYNGLEKGQAILSQNDLAKRFGVSRSTISRRLAKMELAGIISKDRIGNICRYRIEKYLDFSFGKKTGTGEKKLFDF